MDRMKVIDIINTIENILKIGVTIFAFGFVIFFVYRLYN